jgi:hypothetical protein
VLREPRETALAAVTFKRPRVAPDRSAPKVDDEEMVIVKDISPFIESLRGHRLLAGNDLAVHRNAP